MTKDQIFKSNNQIYKSSTSNSSNLLGFCGYNLWLTFVVLSKSDC